MIIMMASENHHQGNTSCLDDPNFATICSFLERFGELCHINTIPFAQLQEMLENTNEVPLPLVQLHIRLLRRVFKSINTSKWEKSVSKFAHMHNSQDGWEIERFGYKKSKMQTKLRILKNLLESQFDYNPKFKGEVNKLLASDLRMIPIGRDQQGHAYWYQVDSEANLRVYREDIDEETWEIVASSREELEQLIIQLRSGEINPTKSPEDIVVEEDTNGLESMDIEPKEILLDTGKVVDEFNEGTNDGTESNECDNEDSMDLCEGLNENGVCEDERKPSVNTKEDSATKQEEFVVKAEDSTLVFSSSINNIVASAEPGATSEKVDLPNAVKCVSTNDEVIVRPNETTAVETTHNFIEEKLREDQLSEDKKLDIKQENDLEPSTGTTSVQQSPYFDNMKIKDELGDENVITTVCPSVSPPSEDKNKKISQPIESEAVATVTPDVVSPYFTTVTEEKSDAASVQKDPGSLINSEGLGIPKVSMDSSVTPPKEPETNEVEIKLDATPPLNVERSSPDQIESNLHSVHEVTDNLSESVCVEKNNLLPETRKLPCTSAPPTVEATVVSGAVPLADSHDTTKGLIPTDEVLVSGPAISGTAEEAVSLPNVDSTVGRLVAEDNSMGGSEETKTIQEIKPMETDADSNVTLPVTVNEDPAISSVCDERVQNMTGVEGALGSGSQQILTESFVPPEPVVLEPVQRNSSRPDAVSPEDTSVSSTSAGKITEELSSRVPEENSVTPTVEESMDCEPTGNETGISGTTSTTDRPGADVSSVSSELTENKLSVDCNEATVNTVLPDVSPKFKEEKFIPPVDTLEAGVVPQIEMSGESEPMLSEGVTKPDDLDDSSVTVEEAKGGGNELSEVPPAFESNTTKGLNEKESETSMTEADHPVEKLSQSTPIASSENPQNEDLEQSEQPLDDHFTESQSDADTRPGSFTSNTQPETVSVSLQETTAESLHLVTGLSVAIETETSEIFSNQTAAITNSADVAETFNQQQGPDVVSGASSHDSIECPKETEELAAQQLNNEASSPKILLVADTNTAQALGKDLQAIQSDNTVAQSSPDCSTASSTIAAGLVANISQASLSEAPSDPVDSELPLHHEDKTQNSIISGSNEAVESRATDEPASKVTIESSAEPPQPEDNTIMPTIPTDNSPSEASEGSTNHVGGGPTVKQASVKPALGLVAYGSSSEDEAEETGTETAAVSGNTGVKRKSEGNPAEVLGDGQPAKVLKVDPAANPIVGKTVEESVMIITGSGEGALNEGGNESPSGSPAPNAASDNDEEEEGYLPVKGKNRGRPKNNRKEVLKDNNAAEKKTPAAKSGRRSSFNMDDVNGVNASAPVRRSGRVAQIRQKEEEERRKLEEERLAQLKEAQVRKQQKQLERQMKAATQGAKPKQPKAPRKPKVAKGSKPNKEDQQVAYLPSSESGSESEPEEDPDEEEYDVGRGAKGGRRKKRKKKTKNGKTPKKGSNPWLHSSSEEDEAVEEEEEEHVEEEEEEELNFNASDHEFSPESDVGEESEYSPSRHARTAKQKEEAVEDKYAETYCDKCGKGDHPEWILLCDSCDKGWHALCVNPQIWVIPEGEWFCPPCQHNMLVNKLSENLVEFDKILKKRENEVLRKQRLAYVGISLNNVLPSADKPEKLDEENGEIEAKTEKKQKHRRGHMFDDPEDISSFINDKDSDSEEEESGSGSYESEEEEPIYQLRQRRATKGFSFREYDDMIKSALRDSDAEDTENQEPALTQKATDNGISGEHVAEAEKVSTGKEGEGNADEVSDEDDNIGRPKKVARIQDDETDEDELDEKERNRRKMLNSNQKKSRRRLNDLDATSEEDSDEDFKGSGMEDEDDEEEIMMDEDSNWSDGGDESDDSIAVARARKKKKHRGPLGRQEQYHEGETVRRSTRRRKSRVTYDESDQEEDDESPAEKWQSGESEESESDSESEDETWGKKKKKKGFPPSKSKLPNFFLNPDTAGKKSKTKKKKRKADEGEVDRAWSNKFGNKVKRAADEPVERKTRGRKINFKDILDSGESDDDGNIRPKRRRILSDSDDDEEPGSSRRLVEEIRAANVRAMAEEKQRAEEKMREMANAEKLQKKEVSQALPTNSVNPSLLSASAPVLTPVSVAAAAAAVLPPPDLHPVLGTLEPEKDRGLKITNSIVESLLRKSPALPESPPTTASPVAAAAVGSGITDPAGVLPTLRGLTQPPYLPSVIPTLASSNVSGSGPGTGSARVGKKKTASMLPIPASTAGDVLPFPSLAKKSNPMVNVPVPSKPVLPGIGIPPPTSSNSNASTPGLPPNISSDLARLAGPLYGNNPALRPFHPAWGRNPPPYSGPPGHSLGKPPPLSSGTFMGQPGQIRGHLPPSNYPQPPPGLRIPNPNTIPAFQQFGKRAGEVGALPYRMPPVSQQIPGSVLSSMARERERIFIDGSPPYGSFGMLPPQGQTQQHPGLFANPFEYRSPEIIKDDLLERSTGQALPPTSSGPPGSQTQPTSTASSTGGPQLHPSAPVVAVTTGPKDEGGAQGDGEFGGLVSYFSSQHSNDED